MKFLHVADLHIGANSSIPGFLERQEAVYDQIFEAAQEHKVDAVVIAGDIWHKPVHSPQERDLWLKKLLQYNQCGFKIIQISGNHDYLEPGHTHLSHITFQADLGRLENVISADTEIKLYRLKDYLFLLMPDQTFETSEFNQEVARRVKELQESSFELPFKGIIVVAHFAVKGCAADTAGASGQQYQMEKGIEVTDNLPVTYIALGDLHIQQRVGPCCYYSGAPIQTRWGEDPEKGGLLVDTDDPDNPTPILFQSKPMLTFYEKPEKWPEDAFIRFVTDKEPPDDLPEDAYVVVKPSKRPILVGSEGGGGEGGGGSDKPNLLENLENYLKEIGCPEEHIEVALDEAKAMAQEKGITLPDSD